MSHLLQKIVVKHQQKMGVTDQVLSGAASEL